MAEKKLKQPVTHGVVKVPVIMQMEALECGAACLCMVMAYYNKWVPLEQVRRDCGVSRDGSKAGNILKAARNYGFTAKGFRYEPETLRQKGKFPCIIHWEFNHFVVCDGFRGNRVYLNDPAKGDYSVTIEKFDESFTGICLMIEPGEEFVPGGEPKRIMDFAKKRLRGAGGALAFVVITSVISTLVGIVSAGFSRVFLDELLTQNQPEWFLPFLIGLIAIAFIQIVAGLIQAIYSLKLDGKMAVVGNSTYMWKVLHLPMEFFSQRMAGDIQQRKESNASIASQIVKTLAPLVLNSVMMVFYFVVMIRYSWLLTLVGVTSVILNLFISRYISKKRVNITRVMMRDSGKLAAATVSGIEMIETIKASGSENGFFEKWSGYQASVNTQTVRFEKLNQYLGMIPSAVSGIMNVTVLILGVWLAMNGSFTPGMIFAFQGFLASFIAPAGELISAGQAMQEMRTSMERIEDVMEYPDDPIFAESEKQKANGEEVSYDKLSGSLVMKNVTFG